MNAKKALIGAGLLGLGILGFAKARKPKSRTSAPKTIEFGGNGETILQLPRGAAFIVTYDTTAPWNYVAQGTDAVPVIGEKHGKVWFRRVGDVTKDAPSQVYVMAVDENEDVMGEHKITVFPA